MATTTTIKGHTITLCSNYNRTYEGFTMPKGAVYGHDDKGAFICYDYKVRKWITWYTPERGDFDMPVLRIWRRKNGAWYSKTEVSYTTSAIIKWFEEGKGYPDISWGDDKFQVSTRGIKVKSVKTQNFRYYEFSLPKGAIYGSDEHGVFICRNIMPHGFHNGLPRMEIWRPVVGGIERSYTTKWRKSIESEHTAYAVWDLIKRENIELDYSDEPHQVAKKQELRASYGTVHYAGLGFEYRKNAHGASFVAYEHERSLDELAAEQKGHPVFTGTHRSI